ncbi:MAG TPA: Fe-S cluster assembly protein SufD [Thermoanaerobaculia bacterium]|nr:Fe-S cluster assembly protein SufD [Thermoanaerobaculia bacterium]
MTAAVATDLREQAAETFAKLGWPTTRLEAWRYTNLAPLQKIAWRTDDAPQAIESPATFAGRAALELVFVNGRLVSTSGDLKLAAPAEVRIADWERNAMVALNTANMQDGARLEIPAGMVVDGFLSLLFIGNGDPSTSLGTGSIWSHPRNQIVVGANAQVAIVETYVGSGSYFTNTVTEIVAGESAVVDHYKLQCESISAYHVASIFIRQERAASVTSRSIAIGGTLARTETNVSLAGEGANVVLDGLFVGTATQHLDNLTAVDHVNPHCESVQLYKGILDGNARGIFDGRIIVRPGAQKTVSRQTNRNLLLSETAIVDSKPNLEIHNDDVKCNHGSTIGQIDDQQLFYLQSRGIAADEARNLLVYAFASEIVDRMKIEPVREQIRRALFQAMPERLPERRAEGRGQRAEGEA